MKILIFINGEEKDFVIWPCCPSVGDNAYYKDGYYEIIIVVHDFDENCIRVHFSKLTP